jgi:hypothetical protein
MRQGINVEEIRREIQTIIDTGLTYLSPEARTYWSNLVSSGVAPTPENLVIYMAKRIGKGF